MMSKLDRAEWLVVHQLDHRCLDHRCGGIPVWRREGGGRKGGGMSDFMRPMPDRREWVAAYQKRRELVALRRRVFWAAARIMFVVVAALAWLSFWLWIFTMPAPARERYPGQYAQVDPAVSQWFKDQQVPHQHYLCCSAADGTKADEATRNGHLWTQFTYTRYDYSVSPPLMTEQRAEWMEVPDDAVIRDGKPNPMGGPVVWYYTEGAHGEIVKIRCFKPADEY